MSIVDNERLPYLDDEVIPVDNNKINLMAQEGFFKQQTDELQKKIQQKEQELQKQKGKLGDLKAYLIEIRKHIDTSLNSDLDAQEAILTLLHDNLNRRINES